MEVLNFNVWTFLKVQSVVVLDLEPKKVQSYGITSNKRPGIY